jgi:YD repeat-containing protein
VTEVGYPEEGNGESEVATYFYQEGADRLASVLDPLGYATSYRYDRADRTAGIVHPGDLVESIEYDTDGRVEQLDLGALVSHSIVRGPDGNVLRVARNLSGGDKVQVERTYDGLGHVTSTVHFAKSGALAERLVTDGRGRLMLRGTMSSDGRSDVRDAVVASHYDPETGALFEQSTDWPLLASDAGDYPRFVEVTYEPGGAISTVGTRSYRSDAHGTLHPPVWMTASAEHNYYDANGRLRYRQQLGILREPDPLRVERVFGAWEEYLYDALGRRVMVRSISGGLCDNPSCYSAERSYAWGGDRIYFERSVPVDGADLIEGQYGSVLYTYGTDSRHPASVVRRDESGVAQAIFPHADWRGRIAMVTDSAGRRCDLGKRGCAGAVWPADLEDEFGAVAADAPLGTWFGSLLDGQRGMTGLLYSNGGHYDPRLGTDVERDVPGPDANDTWGAEWAPRWLTSWEDMGVPGAPRPLLQAVETLPSARGCIGDQCPAHAPTELRTR